MTPFLLILLMNTVALGLALAATVRLPSWRARVTTGVAIYVCLLAMHQVAMHRSILMALLCILGLAALLMSRLMSLAAYVEKTGPAIHH